MAFLKLSSIYDVAMVFQKGFWIPDGTMNADCSVSMKTKDIIFLVLFQVSYIFFGFAITFNDREFIESSSKMLNGGVNLLVNTGFIVLFSCRLIIFGFRYKLWEILELLENCDLLVRVVTL
jgi:hypothetical protein